MRGQVDLRPGLWYTGLQQTGRRHGHGTGPDAPPAGLRPRLRGRDGPLPVPAPGGGPALDGAGALRAPGPGGAPGGPEGAESGAPPLRGPRFGRAVVRGVCRALPRPGGGFGGHRGYRHRGGGGLRGGIRVRLPVPGAPRGRQSPGRGDVLRLRRPPGPGARGPLHLQGKVLQRRHPRRRGKEHLHLPGRLLPALRQGGHDPGPGQGGAFTVFTGRRGSSPPSSPGSGRGWTSRARRTSPNPGSCTSRRCRGSTAGFWPSFSAPWSSGGGI